MTLSVSCEVNQSGRRKVLKEDIGNHFFVPSPSDATPTPRFALDKQELLWCFQAD